VKTEILDYPSNDVWMGTVRQGDGFVVIRR
jgi:hypothetical protein